ncbi:cytochrome P450 [Lentinus tigrinus ALCF2SS1-7]|uniref:Cytochrome P450 n=1 Tax=Lentinus tigrinus ALCF2SS1-6 TaxID=1328759 RepID=A0A5C2RX56_9APHY|nr:cytochrome P450 [Lentinus tigrinus ALCF2SS1-6]RPD71360.1 cytochrome P450 [Lentinus tigrinus ALCF2SS1-7]
MSNSISLIFGLGLVGVLALVIQRTVFRKSSPLHNIPGPSSDSWLKGNFHHLANPHNEKWSEELVRTYAPVAKLTGPFGQIWLHVYDPKALYSIVIKDQDVWAKNALGANGFLVGPGLLTTQGEQHRKQRKMLTPVFSAAYLRNVTTLFYETSFKLRDALRKEVDSDAREVDALKWTGRTALELVGQGALGYSFDPLIEDVTDPFADAVKSFFGATSALRVARTILGPFALLGPAWFRRKVVELIPSTRVQRLKEIVDTMHQRSVDIVSQKKAAMENGDDAILRQIGDGKDIMSILLKANMAASEKEKLSEEEVIAQVSTFILAGMDTTSNATCRLLQLLAANPSVQQKLRDEILNAQAGQEVSYDEVMGLPYLDAVTRETLRLYGPVEKVGRKATQDTVLPLHEPIKGTDGSLITEIHVPKGTIVMLNLWACNTNKALWGEDAYEWKPERWLSPLPRALEEARVPGVYSNLMSFHGGSRACIGFKYAQLELKVVLSVLLTNFKFELTDKDIVWNHAGVAFPSVGKSRKPEMPLKISAIRNPTTV